MKQTNIEDLESAIARVVQAHIAELRLAAATAVERAFSTGVAAPRVRAAAAAGERRAPGRRRAPNEVAGLAERLYAAVCAQPGASMSMLAAQVGERPGALNRPAMHLKRSGRLRSVGQRQGTRYFPMTGKASAKS